MIDFLDDEVRTTLTRRHIERAVLWIMIWPWPMGTTTVSAPDTTRDGQTPGSRMDATWRTVIGREMPCTPWSVQPSREQAQVRCLAAAARDTPAM